MDKKKAVKIYGKDRCAEIEKYLFKLNAYYAFPVNDITLFGFLEDLKNFEISDITNSLKTLEERETDFPLKFNEIKRACKDARANRRRRELKPVEEETEGVPMPENIKIMLEKLSEDLSNGDPTIRGKNGS